MLCTYFCISAFVRSSRTNFHRLSSKASRNAFQGRLDTQNLMFWKEARSLRRRTISSSHPSYSSSPSTKKQNFDDKRLCFAILSSALKSSFLPQGSAGQWFEQISIMRTGLLRILGFATLVVLATIAEKS